KSAASCRPREDAGASKSASVRRRRSAVGGGRAKRSERRQDVTRAGYSERRGGAFVCTRRMAALWGDSELRADAGWRSVLDDDLFQITAQPVRCVIWKVRRIGWIVLLGVIVFFGSRVAPFAQGPADNPYRPVKGLADGGGPSVPGGEWARLPGGREMGP